MDRKRMSYELENNPYPYEFIGVSHLADVKVYMTDFDGYTIAITVGINSGRDDIMTDEHVAELQIFVTDEIDGYYFFLENPITLTYEIFEEIVDALENKKFTDIEDFQDELELAGIYQYSEQQYDIEQDSYAV